MLAVNRVQPLAGRRTPWIFKNHRAIENIGLFLVIWRKRYPPRRHSRIELSNQLRIAFESDLHRLGHSLARQIVLRGAKATHKNHNIGAGERISYRFYQVFWTITDDRLERHRDAQLVEPLSNK